MCAHDRGDPRSGPKLPAFMSVRGEQHQYFWSLSTPPESCSIGFLHECLQRRSLMRRSISPAKIPASAKSQVRHQSKVLSGSDHDARRFWMGTSAPSDPLAELTQRCSRG